MDGRSSLATLPPAPDAFAGTGLECADCAKLADALRQYPAETHPTISRLVHLSLGEHLRDECQVIPDES